MLFGVICNQILLIQDFVSGRLWETKIKQGLSDESLVESSNFGDEEEMSNANLKTKEVAREKLLTHSMALCLSKSYKMVMPDVH